MGDPKAVFLTCRSVIAHREPTKRLAIARAIRKQHLLLSVPYVCPEPVLVE
eukprot:COSAG06_NODE_23510_length_689_cov_1.154237_2_plen_50_part_01